jgi:hydrogenase maturation factor
MGVEQWTGVKEQAQRIELEELGGDTAVIESGSAEETIIAASARRAHA